ncbi:MAG TPA: proton-conducting transporter membrane subunit [Candidatus Binatia bacterium]|jgi:hydrogenase-4 component F|nr:proton-conducting transporter membrane subunit [Candidatus Binatia bacterium]
MPFLTPLLLVPATAALLCLAVQSRRLMEWVNKLAFAGTVALGIRLLQEVPVCGVVTQWEEFFRADALSAWMVLLISIVSLATSLYAGRYFRRDLAAGAVTPGRVKEFYVLTPLFATGMFLVVLANNLGVMWFALEATALSSVLLVALYNRANSLEAAWKYVILGSLGLALALFGTVFTYAAAVDKNSNALPSFNWSHLMSVAPKLDHAMIKLAFIFVLVGYGTKAGLAPMHTWLPDAHSEAPSPTSAMLSGVSLKVALYALLRFHILTTACLGWAFSGTLLLVFGLGSMCLAAPFILVQKNLKRLLAYSSLEHIGLICAAIGLNTSLTIFGALLHMGYHALTKPVLFFAAGNIHQSCHTLQIRLIGPGLAKMLPLTVVGMGLAAVAATGLPPFGLFFSEMTVLNGGFAAGEGAVSTLILAAVLACFCGILYQLTKVLLGAAKPERASDAAALDGVPAMGLMLGTLLVFSVWLPAPLLQLMRQAAGIIQGKP